MMPGTFPGPPPSKSARSYTNAPGRDPVGVATVYLRSSGSDLDVELVERHRCGDLRRSTRSTSGSARWSTTSPCASRATVRRPPTSRRRSSCASTGTSGASGAARPSRPGCSASPSTTAATGCRAITPRCSRSTRTPRRGAWCSPIQAAEPEELALAADEGRRVVAGLVPAAAGVSRGGGVAGPRRVYPMRRLLKCWESGWARSVRGSHAAESNFGISWREGL